MRSYEVKCVPKHTFQDDYPVLNVAISKKKNWYKREQTQYIHFIF